MVLCSFWDSGLGGGLKVLSVSVCTIPYISQHVMYMELTNVLFFVSGETVRFPNLTFGFPQIGSSCVIFHK